MEGDKFLTIISMSSLLFWNRLHDFLQSRSGLRPGNCSDDLLWRAARGHMWFFPISRLSLFGDSIISDFAWYQRWLRLVPVMVIWYQLWRLWYQRWQLRYQRWLLYGTSNGDWYQLWIKWYQAWFNLCKESPSFVMQPCWLVEFVPASMGFNTIYARSEIALFITAWDSAVAILSSIFRHLCWEYWCFWNFFAR